MRKWGGSVPQGEIARQNTQECALQMELRGFNNELEIWKTIFNYFLFYFFITDFKCWLPNRLTGDVTFVLISSNWKYHDFSCHFTWKIGCNFFRKKTHSTRISLCSKTVLSSEKKKITPRMFGAFSCAADFFSVDGLCYIFCSVPYVFTMKIIFRELVIHMCHKKCLKYFSHNENLLKRPTWAFLKVWIHHIHTWKRQENNHKKS